MNTAPPRIIDLITDSLLRELGDSERQELDQWIQASDTHRRIYEDAIDTEKLKAGLEFMDSIDIEQEFEELKQSLAAARPVLGTTSPRATWLRSTNINKFYRKYLAAASTIFLLGLGIAFYKSKSVVPRVNPDTVTTKPEDIPPGRVITRLTWDDSTIQLDQSTKDGFVVQGKDFRAKKENGQVTYQVDDQAIPVSNTVSTPPGSVSYAVVLPDGTKVWLNASSSLRFSFGFADNERKVTLTGEGYFEVSPAYSLEGKRRPFIVQIGGRDVRLEVLGTQFNVNAYADEPYIRTTLIKGSVKVITSTDSTLLKPAQQAEIRNDQIDIIEVGSTGIDAAKAWKEGYFNFKKADVQTILREISRWYDMEIEYKGKIPSLHFDVALRRNTGLKDVLRVLSMNGIDCRIKGKKIIVTPRV